MAVPKSINSRKTKTTVVVVKQVELILIAARENTRYGEP